ncbi:MAG TPA: LysR family transcriptional regulator [Gammaproteobacteria bacterium]
MDIELLRTFVEVYRCRHFGKAADRLYITQSAVSARIRQLETTLGCQLLVRERKQVQPTADGERFLRHAESLLKQWERARRDMTESAAGGSPLRVGAVPPLWEARGLRWLARYRARGDAERVRCESRETDQLMPRLVEGALDLVLQFDMPRGTEIEYRQVGELRLVLAATKPKLAFPDALQGNYIELEWGSAFSAAQAAFMEGRVASLRMDAMHTAIGWLRENDGAAYLPEDIVQRDAFLHPVAGAPEFVREIQAAWSNRGERREAIEAFLKTGE